MAYLATPALLANLAIPDIVDGVAYLGLVATVGIQEFLDTVVLGYLVILDLVAYLATLALSVNLATLGIVDGVV